MGAAKRKNGRATAVAALLLALLLALPASAALPRATNAVAELIDPHQAVSDRIAPAPVIARAPLLPAISAATPQAQPRSTRLRLHLASPPSWPYPGARAWAFESAGPKNRVWGFELGGSGQHQENQWFVRRIAVGVRYARFYDPQLGRFLSHDPVDGDLTNPPSLHKYLYAFQNPTVFVDPDGRMPAEAQESPENLDDLITAEADVVRSGEEIPEGFIVVKAGVGDSLFILPTARLEELGIAVPELGGKEGPSFFERAEQSLKELTEKVAAFLVDPFVEKKRTFVQQFDEAAANRKDSSNESLAQGDQERVNQAKLTVEAAGALGVEAVNTGVNVAGAAGGGKLIVGAAREAAERQAKKRGAKAAAKAAASSADEAASLVDEAAAGTRGTTRLHVGQQGKHIPGHNNYIPGRSPLTHPEPQELLERFAGKGQAANRVPRGQPGFRERVDFGEVIGEVNGEPTTKGIIHYGKDGAHIVPAKP